MPIPHSVKQASHWSVFLYGNLDMRTEPFGERFGIRTSLANFTKVNTHKFSVSVPSHG